MKYLSSIWLLPSLLSLCACSINTKFDDADYRPVGASQPINSETHSVTVTRNQANDKEPEYNTTRYVRPEDAHYPVIANKLETSNPGNTNRKTTEQSLNRSASSTRETDRPEQDAVNDNIIASTIKAVFNKRYGQSEQIMKIFKTVQIHCDNQSVISTDDKLITVCQYQFPRFCGAHKFSIISNETKQILMFTDQRLQRNIIDTLTSNQQSAPGLWDGDDYVSSEVVTVAQLLNNDFMNSNNLGWIVKVDNQEKTHLGRSYYAAINETSKCF